MVESQNKQTPDEIVIDTEEANSPFAVIKRGLFSLWRIIKNYYMMVIYLVVFLLIIDNRYKYPILWGILGIVLITVIFVLYRIFSTKEKRENFLMILRYGETHIFGKPLDKEYWEEGELKNKKVKVVWRKTIKD